jgi:type 2 lantibiotic biosynthesis protein LanM
VSIAQVLAKFASIRRRASASPPAWIDDAIWIAAALQSPGPAEVAAIAADRAEAYPFDRLFIPVVEKAATLLLGCVDASAADNLSESAHASLRHALLKELCSLCAPAIYERFAKTRKANAVPADAAQQLQVKAVTSRYDEFLAEMTSGGFRRLFEDKPVLLRLLALITRQWIETSRELIMRAAADLPIIRRDFVHSGTEGRITKIEGDLSDAHNGGHSVQIVSFEDGSRIVYKPKDLRLDVAWCNLVERLNRAGAPLDLKAVRAIARNGYGWTEFVEHRGCADQEGCKRFFRRAGAWLALFHCFAASDMHHENIIAASEHPAPIDLEMILQSDMAADASREPEEQAFEAAMEIIANSVMMVGLLPAYLRSPKNNVFAVGGMEGDWNSNKARLHWNDINSDAMRPVILKEESRSTPNLPHIGGEYATFSEHIEDFVAGFEDYARFLLRQTGSAMRETLFDGFAGAPVRKVVRPTRFYSMLLQRLKNHRAMDDGVVWSAQVDFLARLADWEKEADSLWPLQKSERSALLDLNVPHFVTPSDGDAIGDAAGLSVRTEAISGLDRARARMRSFDEQEIAWQVEVIRQNTKSLVDSAAGEAAPAELKELQLPEVAVAATREIFIAEADKIADDLVGQAICRGAGAAWIGLDWLGESEAFQLVTLGPELYNGTTGVGVFFAAHQAVTGHKGSGEMALAATSHLRKNLKGRNAARMARSLGTGGCSGLGSIVYALAVMSKCLRDDGLLADAHAAAELFTDDLIAADKQLDVMAGNAGAILGLLRLYRDARSADVLRRAIKCGEHLLRQPRVGEQGRRSWLGEGVGARVLTGMSHGAAGFAYALAALSAATGREDFAEAAAECLAFEDASYDAERSNWPDLRVEPEPGWPCQWCHGAAGIGLARAGMTKFGMSGAKLDAKLLTTDIRNAFASAESRWPSHIDSLCCGTFGNIEFFCEAADALGRDDLRELAARRLTAVLQSAASSGDYRWKNGKRQFNLGLFRGLAGAGYTFLRQVDASLPNVLIWE